MHSGAAQTPPAVFRCCPQQRQELFDSLGPLQLATLVNNHATGYLLLNLALNSEGCNLVWLKQVVNGAVEPERALSHVQNPMWRRLGENLLNSQHVMALVRAGTCLQLEMDTYGR